MDKKLQDILRENATKVVDLCIALYEGRMNPNNRKAPCSELFAQLGRIAERNHAKIRWHGNDFISDPTKFTIFKAGNIYAVDIDCLRSDGVNANCCHNGKYF